MLRVAFRVVQRWPRRPRGGKGGSGALKLNSAALDRQSAAGSESDTSTHSSDHSSYLHSEVGGLLGQTQHFPGIPAYTSTALKGRHASGRGVAVRQRSRSISASPAQCLDHSAATSNSDSCCSLVAGRLQDEARAEEEADSRGSRRSRRRGRPRPAPPPASDSAGASGTSPAASAEHHSSSGGRDSGGQGAAGVQAEPPSPLPPLPPGVTRIGQLEVRPPTRGATWARTPPAVHFRSCSICLGAWTTFSVVM